MKEIILCKYGELVLKGLNKGTFVRLIQKEMTARMKAVGAFTVESAQSTMYITPCDEMQDMDAAYEEAKKVFGIVNLCRAAVVEKDISAICGAAKTYLLPKMRGAKTFKAEAKRADKTFPYDSPAICREVGAALLESDASLRVDVHHPDITVRVEVREQYAYLHAGQEKGAGGMPCGSAGKALLLLSGGIDSPVAGYLIAKRGAAIEALHFDSIPYTSERAKEKVLELAKLVTAYTGHMKVRVISLTHIQEMLRDHCNEDYFTLLLRRFMMRLAVRTAAHYGCDALVTGESLGQVASQTMQALCVTDAVADRPVFRPCIGMDKEEIISIARRIGTFETSIEPYEDCCTVFTPKHPKTRPELEKVLAEEAKLDLSALEEEAFQTLQTYEFRAY